MREGGVADTSVLRERTGLDHGEQVWRSVEALEDAGLVEVREGEWEKEIPAPSVVEVSEFGRGLWEDDEFAFGVGGDEGSVGLGERVDRVERKVRRRGDTYVEMKKRVVELEGDVEELEGKVGELIGTVERLVERGGS